MLGAVFKSAATSANIPVYDTSEVIETDGPDGVHLTADAHQKLGRAVAEKFGSSFNCRSPSLKWHLAFWLPAPTLGFLAYGIRFSGHSNRRTEISHRGTSEVSLTTPGCNRG